jgi:hypothetical protein
MHGRILGLAEVAGSLVEYIENFRHTLKVHFHSNMGVLLKGGNLCGPN